MKKKITMTARLGALLTAAVVLAACGDRTGPADEAEASDGTREAVPVATAPVRAGTAYEIVEATGTVAPRHQADIGAEVQGQVVEIVKDVGDWVQKGDVILRLDPELPDLSVAQAEAQFLGAEAAYRKAERDYQRNVKLFESQDISEFTLENSRLQMQSAKAAYLTAKAALEMAQRQRRKADITAPFNGWVARRYVDLGQTVAPGVPVVRVVDISSVKVEVGLAEKDIVKVRENQKAVLILDVYPGRTFPGRVSAVGPEADVRSRSFPVEISAANSAEQRLRAGMVAKVRIFTKELKGVPIIPRAALLERSNKTLLFVVRDGLAAEREPVLGVAFGDSVAVLEGVAPGETVVIAGQENLADGTRVVVR
jgi:RND family efflux transporter MFP subunit